MIMRADEIRTIALRRLHELEKQATLNGPNTPPEILIEIQELHTTYPGTPRNGQRHGTLDHSQRQNEYDFLMTTVSAGLVRLTKMEIEQADRGGKLDQVLHGVGELRNWVRVIAGAAVVALVLALVLAIVVF